MSLGERPVSGASRAVAALLALASACKEGPAPAEPTVLSVEEPVASSIDLPDVPGAEPIAAPEPPATDSGPAPGREVRLGGEPILLGAMGATEFLAVIEAHRADLTKCLRSNVEQTQVVLKLTITKDGTVSGATMKTPSNSYSVDRCLEKVAMDLHFPPPANGIVVAALPLDLGANP